MDRKIRVPKLRSVLIGMLLSVVVLLGILHREAQVQVANQRTTGLGAVAGSLDPISELSLKSGPVGRIARISGGIVGGVPEASPSASPARGSAPKLQMSSYFNEGEGGGGGGDSDKLAKKLIRTVTLELLVKDARTASLEVQQVAQQSKGEIEHADLRNVTDITRSADLALRVPAAELESIVARLRRTAMRVQSEHWESKDITREYTDSESRLRNMKAAEQQYLILLKRAGSMKDTLEVTEKISEVRGEIEQLQGELNWWSHQVEMSAIQISLTEEPQATVAARWRPLYNAKNAARDMLLGLGEWVDWAVAFIIDLPLILIWVCSIGGLFWAGWKILRFVWLRWLKPKPAPEVHAAT